MNKRNYLANAIEVVIECPELFDDVVVKDANYILELLAQEQPIPEYKRTRLFKSIEDLSKQCSGIDEEISDLLKIKCIEPPKSRARELLTPAFKKRVND